MDLVMSAKQTVGAINSNELAGGAAIMHIMHKLIIQSPLQHQVVCIL